MDSSPLPIPVKESLEFGEAMSEIILKKRITKLEWKDTSYYGFLDEGKLRLHKPDGTVHDWIISEGDLDGDDFVVV